MEYNSLETIQALAPNEINRMTNPQLKKALTTLVAARREDNERDDNPTNAILLQEIQMLRQEVAEIRQLKKEVQSLSNKLDDAFATIHSQQLFMEAMDGKERRCNLVISGVKESEDGAGSSATDAQLVKEVIEKTGYSEPFNTDEWEMRRLGQPNERKRRPIHVKVKDPKQRDGILAVAKNLKDAEGSFSTVYIKKDLHPCIRKEYARLRKREKEERDKASNTGTVIVYDWKNRVLLRDGLVIDRFAPRFF